MSEKVRLAQQKKTERGKTIKNFLRIDGHFEREIEVWATMG